jgi:NADPH-dependent curcumin reductase CurA
MKSLEVHLLERPSAMPMPEHFRLVDAQVADPVDGQVLVENIYMSVDPAMRPRLAGQQALNVAMMGGAIGRC